MEFKNLVVEKKEGVGIISVDRQKALNSLNKEVLDELDVAVANLDSDTEVDVLIITGKGKAFVAGADIAAMSTMSHLDGRDWGRFALDVFRKIEMANKPVIAAVNGYALGGGCELALSCDMRIGSTKAIFGQPEVKLGITPGFGGTQRLARLVGTGKAKELIFTGEMINAEEALKIGLVNHVVAEEELLDKAIEIANKIRANSQLAVRFAKSAINRGIETDLETGMEIERDLFGLCFANEDQKEGMKAFLEKRKPEFKNK
jgi:enoyl-CoA hydratase